MSGIVSVFGWMEIKIVLSSSVNKEFAAVKKQLESALASAEELRQAGQTSNEIVAALQARLVELEPELFQCKEKIKEQERLISAAAMMKVRFAELL